MFKNKRRAIIYIYNDEVKAINTAIHYYWYSDLFTNYFACYTQAVLHLPEDIAIEYNESISKNEITDLSKNFRNYNNKSVKVYPNPIVTDVINLRFIGNEEAASVVELFDASGKSIKQFTINVNNGINNHALQISKQSKGIYLLKGIINGNIFTNKVIIE